MTTSAERIEAIYASLPPFECKGLCWRSCSFIGTGTAERRRLRVHGISPPSMVESPCKHLDWRGMCAIHAERPMVCRLYGMIPSMRCDHGCKPVMDDEEGRKLFREVLDLP